MAKILLIEDDPDQIALYSAKFSLEGLKMITARTGEAGLKKAVEEKPDFILIDIVLEEMDGMEVLKRLKKDKKTKDIPAAIITNLLKGELIEEAKKLGAVGFWPKTEVMPYQVVNRIKEILKIKNGN